MKIEVDAPEVQGKERAYDQAVFVIWASHDGRTNWVMVKPQDVPDWVKHPQVLGNLVNGEMCCDPREGEKGSLWYRADVFLGEEARAKLEGALKARDLREAHRLLTIQ